MASRLNISVSDDMRKWLEEQAKMSGIPMSSFATMLLNEARRYRDMTGITDKILLFMNTLSADEREAFFSGRKKADELPGFVVLPDELQEEIKRGSKGKKGG